MTKGFVLCSAWLIFMVNVFGQRTTKFKGRLISLSGDNSMVKRVPIRLVGVTSGLTSDDGSFAIAISEKITELTLKLENNKHSIVSPVGGKAHVPVNPDAITEFYIGEPPE